MPAFTNEVPISALWRRRDACRRDRCASKRRGRAAVLIVLAATAAAAGAPADPPHVAADRPPISQPAGGPAGPDTYLLPDKDGKLQKVLGYRYEDFVEAFKITNGVAETSRQPRYSLQQFAATGRASATLAELRISLRVILTAEGPIGVPIGLGRAVLRGPPTGDDAQPPLVHFDRSTGGYVVWLRGGKEKVERKVEFDVLVPVDATGDEHILRLAAPRAASSRCTLQVEGADVRARVSQPSILTTTRKVEGGTELTATGLDAQFEIGWQPADRAPLQPTTVLESTGAIVVRIDDRHIVSEASLSVRGFGGTFDRFMLRLPPGGQLMAISDPSYTVFPVAEPPNKTEHANAAPLVEIRLAQPTSGPVDIHCVVQQSLEKGMPSDRPPSETTKAGTARPKAATGGTATGGTATGGTASSGTASSGTASSRAADRSFRLGGFDVVGAVRQAGHVAVHVMGDWYIRWGDLQGAIRVDDLPEALRAGDPAAGFEYFRQPFSLSGQLVRRKTSVRVEPQYLLLVGQRQIALSARLRYRVRVKKLAAVELRLPGWEIETESIRPDDLFDVDAVTRMGEGKIRIPLRSPREGSFELRFRARHVATAAGQRVAVDLPLPLECLTAPSTVVVLPDDQVQLVPQFEASAGLTPQRIAPPVDLPPRQQPAFYYQGDPEGARFVALRHTHPRSVTTRVSARAHFHPDRIVVEETIAVRVAYQPLDTLTFRAAFPLHSEDQIRFRLADQPLKGTVVDRAGQPTEPADRGAAAGAEGAAAREDARAGPTREAPDPGMERTRAAMATVRVALPKPTIGDFQVIARYELSRQRAAGGGEENQRVALLVPTAGAEETQVALDAPASSRVAVTDPRWNRLPAERAGPASPQARVVRLVANGPQAVVPVLLSRADAAAPRTMVDRLWLQTWIGGGVRRDRAVYRFERAARQWTFSLPAGVRKDRILVTIDGKAAPATLDRRGRLLVPIGSGRPDGPARLELTYELACERARGAMDLDLPRLEGNPWIRQTFWELILPERVHLVRGPPQFLEEQVWQLNQLFWSRRPALTTEQLEAWAGVRSEVPMPAHLHRYLFGGLGNADHVVLWTASRASLVLISSGLVLVVGLLWIYLPSMRRTGVLLTVGVGITALGMAYPDPALLLLQASGLGMVLVALAALLERLVARREGASRTLVHSGGSSIVAPVTTTEIHLPAATAGESSSASTRIATSLPASDP